MTKTDESETSFRVDRAKLIWLATRRALLAGIGLVVVGGLALWASKDNPTW